ncbi:MAG: tRNA(Ile)-lysidine synthetase (EC [uncultured Thiotrichaceae bacterium]|uniref:tRNA(Ile)-lysidine synthase n=1 Tax=uncultured Thiotrichaceae bacterium TaxID=298394 RepID=A0A6S6TQ07_9GAMM|nr:MAG: tRNA(Ile)-lysidine synthetase (EC [uncultured Thiotrichaceae bacterium]
MAIFDSQTVVNKLLDAAPSKQFLIGYSGGLDSHVLLHFLSQARNLTPSITVRSLYVDHGLQAESQQWATHCQTIADSLNIDHQTTQLNLQLQSGESVEAVARNARYQAFSDSIQTNEILLTAQHQDDQAETLLLQLMRGAGLDGLSAMPYRKELEAYTHIRPLLDLTRKQLEEYANKFQLDCITDPSNTDTRFDRNFLRQKIFPALQERWPTISNTIMRSASHLSESRTLLEDYIQLDMPTFRGTRTNTLSIQALQTTSINKQKAIIRYWIKEQGFLTPSSSKLTHLFSDVINAKEGSTPLLEWKNTEIRRFQDDLHIINPPPKLSTNTCFEWDIQGNLTIPPIAKTLSPTSLGDLEEVLLKQNFPVTVRFRQGGERIKARRQEHSQSVKKLLQAANVPPWERSRIPMIYAGEQLIQVVGIATIDKRDLLDETH